MLLSLQKWLAQAFPDPKKPCFFGIKEQGKPPEKKKRVFLFAEPLNPWKRKEKCPKCFFGRKKSKGNPEKNKGFSLCGTPKILAKERKITPKKQGKSENEKSKGQGARGRQQKGETGPGTHIFADFRRFSARSVNQRIWESQICAENRRFLQKAVSLLLGFPL